MVATATLAVASSARAQADTSRAQTAAPAARIACDSVLRAARFDTAITEVRGYLLRADSGTLAPRVRAFMMHLIVTHLVLPQPLQLPVFGAGPVRLRMLRPERLEGDEASVRAPAVYGVYRFRLSRGAERRIDLVVVDIPSLAPGLDSSVVRALVAAANDSAMTPVLKELGKDGVVFQLRLTSGSGDGRVRVPPVTIFAAAFPRLRMTDAHPSPENLPPEYPLLERLRGGDGEVLVRVVINADGSPLMRTAEILHATSSLFGSAALSALSLYRFTPARVGECAVSQVLEVPFWFSLRP